MLPASGPPSTWSVPSITTLGGLARRLRVAAEKLDGLVDIKGLERWARGEQLHHYHYRWLPKDQAAPLEGRLLEAPKTRLKAAQRELLRSVLDAVPPHDAAHAYRKGRSIHTHAELHAGRAWVLRMDLRRFFASIRASRIHALFRTMGYPETVARALTGLCTNRVPPKIWRRLLPSVPAGLRRQQALVYTEPHLPQGAPTSPALANLCALRLDQRSSALAQKLDARYSRYGDDLTFSGDRRLKLSWLVARVGAIALEEGFSINHRKTLRMPRAQRQRVTGVVVNARPNICRADFDRLKATLFNCAKYGPQSQNHGERENFRAYLLGKIGFVAQLNPARAEKLRALFARIDWSQTTDAPASDTPMPPT